MQFTLGFMAISFAWSVWFLVIREVATSVHPDLGLALFLAPTLGFIIDSIIIVNRLIAKMRGR